MAMASFALDPDIRVQHQRYRVLRTIDDAIALVRDMAATAPKREWQGLLRLLEHVRTEDDALEAAVALEGLLERESMLIEEPDVPAPVPALAATGPRMRAGEQVPAPAGARSLSMLYTTARAEPEL